jgi:glycosyltransferase involved in cell wall biosynthesis
MMNKKKLIIFILHDAKTGGSEYSTICIANSLANDTSNFNVEIIFINMVGELLHLIDKKIIIHDLSKTRILFTINKLYNLLNILNPNYIVSTKPHISAVLPFLVNKKKIILREATTPSLEYKSSIKNFIISFLLNKAYNKCYFIIHPTYLIKKDLIKFYSIKHENFILLPNAIFRNNTNEIDIKLVSKIQDNYYNCLCIGRISPEKNYTTTFKAISIVSKKYPNFKLYIFGDYTINNDHYQELKLLIKKLNIQENIVFLGFISNPELYFNFFKIYIQSSLYEGLPNAYLLALKSKILIISSQFFNHFSDNGKYSLHFRTLDYNELANNIISVIQGKKHDYPEENYFLKYEEVNANEKFVNFFKSLP